MPCCTHHIYTVYRTHGIKTTGHHLLCFIQPYLMNKQRNPANDTSILNHQSSHVRPPTTSQPCPHLLGSYPKLLLSPSPSFLILCIPCSPLTRVSWYLSKGCLSCPCNPLLASSCLRSASSCSRRARWLRSSKSSAICCASRWRRCWSS